MKSFRGGGKRKVSTHPSRKGSVRHLSAFRALTVHDPFDLCIAEIDASDIFHRLQHRSPDQWRHEICSIEGRLLLLDELPDGLFGEFLADAVGNLFKGTKLSATQSRLRVDLG